MNSLATVFNKAKGLFILSLFLIPCFSASASHALEAMGDAIFVMFWTAIGFAVISLGSSVLALFYKNKFLEIVSLVCGVILFLASLISMNAFDNNPIVIIYTCLISMLIIHRKKSYLQNRNSQKFRIKLLLILTVLYGSILGYLVYLLELSFAQFIILNLLGNSLIFLFTFSHFIRRDKNENTEGSSNYPFKFLFTFLGFYAILKLIVAWAFALKVTGLNFFHGLLLAPVQREFIYSVILVGISGALANIVLILVTRKKQS